MANKHQPESELRIVLLGKTGVGKSASGNTILNRNEFKSEPSPSSVTVKCEKKTREFDGQKLVVVDTPGMFHTSKNPEEVTKEIQDSTMWLTPGPHVFLLVMKTDAFSRQDKKMLEAFQKVFPHATKNTIVLFTHANEDQVKAFIKSHEDLRKFIKSCETYHVFNNKVKDESQVTGLLQKMNKIKKERGHYSNEMFKEALKALEQIMPQKKSPSEVDETILQILNVLNIIGKHVDYSKIAEMLGVDVSAAKTAWKHLDSYRKSVIKWVHDRMPSE